MRDTKAKLLGSGLDLLSRDGLGGLSIGRVADRAGLSKSGVFAHVRSKDQLAIALLDAGADLANRHVVAPAMAAPEGLPRLRALIDLWFGWSTRAGLGGGCPVAAALFELDDASGPVRDHVQALEARWRSFLSTLVDDAVRHGELVPHLDRAQFVWELCGLYLSHHVSSRFLRDPAADERARVGVDALVRGAADKRTERSDDPC